VIKTKRILAPGLFLLATGIVSAGEVPSAHGARMETVSAVPGDQVPMSEDEQKRQVMATIQLRPEPTSEVLFEALDLDILTTGHRVLRGRIVTTASSVDERIYFVADAVAGTYRATRVERMASDDMPGLPLSEGSEPSPATLRPMGGAPPPSIPEPGDGGCSCIDRCAGSWSLSISTIDPVYEALTTTTANGSWGVTGSYSCHWYYNGNGSCSAANPSSINTHWYTSGCQQTGPTSSFQNFNIQESGHYYNWDFGSNALITNVDQSVQITLLPDQGVSIGFSHQDSGEYSSFLGGYVAQTGSNNCF
jgi:hypothetical protein